MEPRIALATCAELPDLDPDEHSLEPLRARGVDARPAVWDDATVDWDAFDLVVIRSTWDYRRAARCLPGLGAVRAAHSPSGRHRRLETDKHYTTSMTSRTRGAPENDEAGRAPQRGEPGLFRREGFS